MMKTLPLIVVALRDPRVLPGWELSQWDLLLRQLRQAGLTASLHAQLQSLDLLSAIPSQPRRHFLWAAQAAAQHHAKFIVVHAHKGAGRAQTHHAHQSLANYVGRAVGHHRKCRLGGRAAGP